MKRAPSLLGLTWLLALSVGALLLAPRGGSSGEGGGKPGEVSAEARAWAEAAKQRAEATYQQAKQEAEETYELAKRRATAEYEQAKQEAESEAARKAAEDAKKAAEQAADQAKKAAERAAEQAKKEALETAELVAKGQAPIPSAPGEGAGPERAAMPGEPTPPPGAGLNRIPGILGIKDAAPGARPGDKASGPPPGPQPGRSREAQPGVAVDVRRAWALPEDRTASARDPRIDALLRSAKTHANMREWGAANRDASQALSLDPQDGEALQARAQAELRLGLPAEAARDAKAAVAQDPEEARRWTYWADALYAAKDYAKALEAIERALALHPDDAGLWYRKAALLDQAGRREEALSAIAEAARLDRAFERVRAAALRGGRLHYPDLDGNILIDDMREARRRATLLPWLPAAACLTLAGALLVVFRRRRARVDAGLGAVLPSPKRFADKYERVRSVSTDAGGEWLEATDKALQRVVAVRRFGSTGAAERRGRIADAARAAASIRHPGLMEVYEVLEDGEDVYVVTEAPLGKSVARLLAEAGRLPMGQVVSILESVCAALGAAHARGIAHGRLATASVIVMETGAVKLAGLGISAAEGGPAREAMRQDLRALAGCVREMAGAGALPPGLQEPSSAAELLAGVKAQPR